MKNTPNKIDCLDTDMGVIIAEALRLAKVNNVRVHQEWGRYCLQRGRNDIIISLDPDGYLAINLRPLNIDGRISKKYWGILQGLNESDGILKILLADPKSLTKLAEILRAVKPCWQ